MLREFKPFIFSSTFTLFGWKWSRRVTGSSIGTGFLISVGAALCSGGGGAGFGASFGFGFGLGGSGSAAGAAAAASEADDRGAGAGLDADAGAFVAGAALLVALISATLVGTLGPTVHKNVSLLPPGTFALNFGSDVVGFTMDKFLLLVKSRLTDSVCEASPSHVAE